MGKLFQKIKLNSSKFITNFRHALKHLKYMDKTQRTYYIVTSFLGIFFIFTGVTYSAFVVSTTLNSATITIAKLNYTLSSTTSGYSNGVIAINAGETKIIDLTLTSRNPITTKYALVYESTGGNTTVYYSHNLSNNMVGQIGANGSSITLRVVAVNNGATSSTVTLSALGGYAHNSLSTNIIAGFYEQDVTIRTVLLDDNFSNPTSGTFPTKTSNYAYYKTVCSEEANPVWDYDNWEIVLNNLTRQISCDVYFKQMSSDVEIDYILVDSNGVETMSLNAPANDGTYTFVNATCSSNASASWNSTSWQLEVSDIDSKTLCIAKFRQN